MERGDRESKPNVPLRLDKPSEFGTQCLELFVKPGLERRRAAGEALPPDNEIHAIQVIFDPDGGFSVRLNDEIEGHLEATLYDDAELDGDAAISIGAIRQIERFTADEADANAAHVTLLRLRTGWVGFVNLFYNVGIGARLEAAAAEFLDAAQASLADQRYRPFADNLHSAVELLAQANIYIHAEHASISGGRASSRHRRTSATYRKLGADARVDARFVALHNRVSNVRAPARYALQSFALPAEEAQALYDEARAMQGELREFIANDQ